MTNRTNERTPMVITLVALIVLVQLGCLSAIGISAWQELSSPTSPLGDYPDLNSAVFFRGEVYYRVLDMQVFG